MKYFILVLILIGFTSIAYAESPPVIITQVELWSPPTFSEDVNLCLGGKTLGPWSYQWIELHNLRNETITMTDNVELNFSNGAKITMNGFTLDPNESCLIQTADQVTTRMGPGGSEGNGPPSGYDGSLVSIQYIIKTGSMITEYQYSTSELSDTFGDTRVWQLIDGKWLFKEYSIPDVKRIIFSKTIGDDSIRVNLTLAEEMQPPLMTKFKVDFMDDMRNHLNDVKYEITYSGVDQMKQSDNGFALNGTDIKFMEFTQPDSIIITISILGIDRKIFDKPQTVEFSSIIIGGTNKPLYYPLLSPLKQFSSGILFNEIQCNDNLILIHKYDGSPACVTESTKQKLIERGWGNKTIAVQNSDFVISYSVTKGELISAMANLDMQLLVLDIQMVDDANMTVKLPRGLIDSINNGKDEVFTVLVEGKKVEHKEQNTQNHRILNFPLLSSETGSVTVEIIPFCPPWRCD